MTRVPLKWLCSTIGRGTSPAYSEEDAGSALVVGQSCQRPGGGFDLARARWHDGPVPEKGRLAGGEVLINSTGTGTLGRVALVDRLPGEPPVFIDTHVTMLRFDTSRVDPRYMAYSLGLASSRAYIEDGLSVGATKQRELSGDALRSHPVTILPLAEQRRVADALDRECARLDELLAALGRFAADTRRAFFEESFQRLCEGEPTIRLRYLLRDQTNGAWGAEPSEDDVDCACVRVADFDRSALLVTEAPTQRSLPIDQASRLRVAPGDLLLEKSGGGAASPVGFVARYAGPAGDVVCSNFIARLRPAPGVDPVYLTHVFGALYFMRRNEPFVKQVTGIQNLDSAAYLDLRVPVLGPAEQTRVAAAQQARLDRVLALEAEIRSATAALGEYREALIAEAVTGALDLRAIGEARLEDVVAAAAPREQPEVLSR